MTKDRIEKLMQVMGYETQILENGNLTVSNYELLPASKIEIVANKLCNLTDIFFWISLTLEYNGIMYLDVSKLLADFELNEIIEIQTAYYKYIDKMNVLKKILKEEE